MFLFSFSFDWVVRLTSEECLCRPTTSPTPERFERQPPPGPLSTQLSTPKSVHVYPNQR
ncbi:hypothetical protein BGW80DRAFT_1358109 [Lactifluus volemus]|nr:hypothetical protein BGW80DRAFT_1358109 [Lactifluus volemus]